MILLTDSLQRSLKLLLFLSSLACICACTQKQEKTEVVDSEEKKSTQAIDESTSVDDKKYILFFGNSLTAGYGLKEEESFPSLIQERIDSLGLNYTVINAGLSGETTAGGEGRIDWVLRQPIDVFVLELGGNDVLRGLDIEDTERNLKSILDRVKAKYPEIPIVVAGMQSPPNMGPDYTNRFNGIYPKLAEEYNAALIPFLLDGVGGIPALNLPDRIHPNAEGQKIVRDNVWTVLKEVL